MFRIDSQAHRSSGYSTITTTATPISKVDNTSTSNTSFTTTRVTCTDAWTLTNVVTNDIAVTSDGYWGLITGTGTDDSGYPYITVNEWVNRSTEIAGTPTATSTVTVHRLGLVNSIVVKALSTNTQIIYVGRHGTATTTDLALEAGMSVTLSSDTSKYLDVTKVYVRSASGTQYATFVQGVGGEGVSQSGGITVTDSTMTNLGWVSVTDSGAVGDGTTDDTTAIGDAITSAAAGNGIIYFPSGTYKITSDVTVTSPIHVIMARGAIVKPAWCKVFTISGTLEAGAYQIFDDNNGVGTDGTFTTDTGNWTKGAGWTIDAGVARHTAGNTGTLSYAAAAGVNGEFMLKYTIGGTVNGGLTPSIGDVSGQKRIAAGTYLEFITATGTGALTFTPETNFGGTIDNVEVYMLGTHVLAAGSVGQILPQWWGAAGIDDSTDNSNAFNKALSATATCGTLYIPTGTYQVDTPICNFPNGYNGLPTAGIVVHGAGVSDTIIKYMGSDAHYAIEARYEGHYIIGGAATVVGTVPGYVTISDMQIQANTATSDGGGIKLGCAVHANLRNLAFLSIANGNAIAVTKGRITMTDSGHLTDTPPVREFTSSTSGTSSKFAIKFVNKTGVAGPLKSATVRLKMTGNPTGTISAAIYSNSAGVPGTQRGDSSTAVNCNSLSTSESLQTFSFPYDSYGDVQPALVSATTYWLVLETSDYTYADGVTEVILCTKASDTNSGFAVYDDDTSTWGAVNDRADITLVVGMGQSLLNYADSCFVGSSGVAGGLYIDDDSQIFIENSDILTDNCVVLKGDDAYLNITRSQLSCGSSPNKAITAVGGYTFFNQCYLEGGGTTGTGFTFDGGEHSFNQITGGWYPSWTAGTIIHYGDDVTHRYPVTNDPTFRMNTDYIISADDDRVTPYNGSAVAVDADALSGNCVQADAQYDGTWFYFGSVLGVEAHLPRGAYLFTIYAKDSKQVASDFYYQVGWNDGSGHSQSNRSITLTSAYKPYRLILYVGSTQLTKLLYANFYKAEVTSNTISVSHITVKYLGTDTLHVEDLIAHNVEATNADGARESRVQFIGRQDGGELTALAEIKASHDGDQDDEKGKLIIGVNDGDDGFSPTNRFQISANGDVILGSQAALATNATAGFVYIPSCAGTPTGVPANPTGKVAMVYDSTNNKLYIYDGGWVDIT